MMPAIEVRDLRATRSRREVAVRRLPAAYAVDGMQRLTDGSSGFTVDGLVVAGCSVVALALGAAALQRRSN
jgi:ABC-2 type transport system permease protein